MKIELKEVTVKELFNGYQHDEESDGIVAYNGQLNVRPPYQREFIYGPKERDAVIDTVRNGYPLNVMYWSKSKDGYELLDGQQRTLSICQYMNKEFSINYMGWVNLSSEERQQIEDYKLTIYVCEGTEAERLKWFETINIAGKPLTDQELRNAIYSGSWVTDAKSFFSKNNGPCYRLAGDYLNGTAIRQDYFKKALEWICDKEGLSDTRQYMSLHQHDENADELIDYFKSVIKWVKSTFPTYRKSMKGVDWGILYNRFGTIYYDAEKLNDRIDELIMDDDVTRQAGIYPYLLDGDQRHLSIRSFTKAQKQRAFTRQNGICPICGQSFSSADEMEADHITPWHLGGRTIDENCQCLCKSCNRTKSGK